MRAQRSASIHRRATLDFDNSNAPPLGYGPVGVPSGSLAAHNAPARGLHQLGKGREGKGREGKEE